MSEQHVVTTDRRSLVKTGALIAIPLAVVAPAVALAADDNRDRLAILEDERAIEALQARFLREMATSGLAAAQALLPVSAPILRETDILRLTSDGGATPDNISLAQDRKSATYRHACAVTRYSSFDGNSTLEKMARLQGTAKAERNERQVLETRFVKQAGEWKMYSAALPISSG